MPISKDQCNVDMSLAERKHSELVLNTNVQINEPGRIGKTWTDESGMFGPICKGVSDILRYVTNNLEKWNEQAAREKSEEKKITIFSTTNNDALLVCFRAAVVIVASATLSGVVLFISRRHR